MVPIYQIERLKKRPNGSLTDLHKYNKFSQMLNHPTDIEGIDQYSLSNHALTIQYEWKGCHCPTLPFHMYKNF